MIGIDAADAVLCSAKTGEGVSDLLEALAARLPPPAPAETGDGHVRAMVVDSWYDRYLGVIALVRVREGALRRGLKMRLMATGAAYDIDEVGVFTPKRRKVDSLGPGEIGYVSAAVKTVADCKVGDTITDDRRPAPAARCPVSSPICRSCSAGCSRPTRRISSICGRASPSCG